MKVHCSVYFINGFESAALINHFCWSKSQTWFISNSRNHYCHTAVLLLVSSSFSHLENEGYKTSNTDLYEVMLGTNDLKCFLGIWFCFLILSNSGENKTKQRDFSKILQFDTEILFETPDTGVWLTMPKWQELWPSLQAGGNTQLQTWKSIQRKKYTHITCFYPCFQNQTNN